MERPKLEYASDEEDLIRIQEEFLASKIKPSATVVKMSEKRKLAEPEQESVPMDTRPSASPSMESRMPKKSRFRMEREKQGVTFSRDKTAAPSASASDKMLGPEGMQNKQDKGNTAVVGSVVERDTRNFTLTEPSPSTDGFPLAFKASSYEQESGSGPRQSIFAQEMARRGLQACGIAPPAAAEEEADRMDTSTPAFFAESGPGRQDIKQQASQQSNMVDGRGLSASQAKEEAQSIHKENMERLARMPQEDILAEQQRLLQLLDPSMVEFLRSKSSSTKPAPDRPTVKAKRPKPAPPQNHPTQSANAPDISETGNLTKFVHMDKVEYNKLEWMKDLPLPSACDKKTDQQARFDFKGHLMTVDADIPVNRGLHHHGEEPERAGYSIGELFQLARSTNVQQRTLALTTLGNIISKAKDGSLEELIQTPILPSILDAGVIFLLRWACDDSVKAVVFAALSALCALLCNPADETALDWVSPWYQGSMVPAMTPQATVQQMAEERMEEDDDNKAEETDAEMAKRDLILGLMSRMMLQQRLFYILDVMQPSTPTVERILSILTRAARHSTQMAYEISRDKKLMDLIFHNFLPIEWMSEEAAKSEAKGRPMAAAMRLVGALCQGGRHIAARLTAEHHLEALLVIFITVRDDPAWLTVREAENLHKASMITWRILLSYGLAADVFVNFYPVLMEQLKEMMGRMSDLSKYVPVEADVYLVSALEGVLPVAALATLKSGFNLSEGTQREIPVTSSVNWSHVDGLCPLLLMCTEQWLAYLAQNYTEQRPSLQFSVACLNFMATYYQKWLAQAGQNTVDCLERVEKFVDNYLLPFLQSWGFSSIVGNLGPSSNVMSLEGKRQEVVSCLPELGCDGRDGRMPVVMEQSSVGFVLALCRLVHQLCKVHKGMMEQTVTAILSHGYVVNYMQKVTTCSSNHLHNNHFTRMETLLQYFLVKLSALVSKASRPPMMHQLALDVMSRLQEGEEYLAHDIMTTVLFDRSFIPEGTEEELEVASMANLKISATGVLKVATLEEVTAENLQLLRSSFAALPLIRERYFKAFGHMEKKVAQSRCHYLQLPQDIDSLVGGDWQSSLMPQDWPFLPLVQHYNRFLSVTSESQRAVELSSVSTVASALQWIFLLEMWRPRALTSTPVTLKLSRLMCVFLGGNQLFLEKSVYPYLVCLFRLYTTPRLLNTLNFEEKLPGIIFYDLYMQLLEQYEGVSYGDPVFSAYVLLPMLQSQSCLLRRAVWQERSHLLNSMRVPVQEMLIDVERFLTPEETDPQLLQLYGGCLLSGAVRRQQAPFFFLVALHHLNRFLYHTRDQAHGDLRQTLWGRVLRCPDESLKQQIIHFKQVDTQAADCTEMYAQLPANRQEVLSHHQRRLELQQQQQQQ